MLGSRLVYPPLGARCRRGGRVENSSEVAGGYRSRFYDTMGGDFSDRAGR